MNLGASAAVGGVCHADERPFRWAATRRGVTLLEYIAAAFQPESRSWVHASWVCLGIFLISLTWWFFWSYQEVNWNYARFLIALLPVGLLYVLAARQPGARSVAGVAATRRPAA